MVVRRNKKSAKQLGNRTRHGNKKNWRGKGSRGGHGNAGSQKHKRMRYQHLFGMKKRMAVQAKPLQTVNLSDIDRMLPKWISEDKVGKNGQGQFVVDGKKIGIQKILGRGNLKADVSFVNVTFSKKASDKLEGTEFGSDDEAQSSGGSDQ